MHVFINAGLKHMGDGDIKLLEIGLGTGLNATLTAIHGDGRRVHYTALEPFPVAIEVLEQMRYFSAPNEHTLHREIIHARFENNIAISPCFQLLKVQKTLQEFATHESFDLVYFDAFAPMVQPEIWTSEIFEKLYHLMNPKAVLVTYCAKGQVRRNMVAAGFSVERIAGPPGKREMLRAIKTS